MELFVKDDYLPKDKFNMLLKKAQELTPASEMERYFFKEDPTPEIAEYINYFTKKRDYQTLSKLVHINATPPNFNHPIHDEASFKIMSAIIYLGPEVSHGTTFYMDEEIHIEWKPNRLMIFCGETGVTWHDFKSGDHVRHTYNYFLCDSTQVQNETITDNLLRM
jgi:hypothetical protein